VIVDGGVDEAVADYRTAALSRLGCGLPIAYGLLAGQDPVAAAVGNVAELLDVDVDHLAGALSLVAAIDLARGTVHPAHPVQAVAGQDAEYRRSGHSQYGADASEAELALTP
jgi:hypothetical protein